MRVKARFKYNVKVTSEELPILREITGANESIGEDGVLKEYFTTRRFDLLELARRIPRLLSQVEIEEEDGVTGLLHVSRQLDELMHRLNSSGNADQAYNQKVNVHVPGFGLLAISGSVRVSFKETKYDPTESPFQTGGDRNTEVAKHDERESVSEDARVPESHRNRASLLDPIRSYRNYSSPSVSRRTFQDSQYRGFDTVGNADTERRAIRKRILWGVICYP